MLLHSRDIFDAHLEALRSEFLAFDRPPSLHVVLVGEDRASQTYVRNKKKKVESLGGICEVHTFDADIDHEMLVSEVSRLNARTDIDAILIQLPLPKALQPYTQDLIDLISPEKDIDGLTSVNMGKLLQNRRDGIVPCTPQAIMHLIRTYRSDLPGKHLVMIGRSEIVGKPLALLALAEHMSISVLHSHTRNLRTHTRKADIIVVATGKVDTIDDADISPGTLVIDVGINRLEDRLTGDAQNIDHTRSDLTAVPGGVGPMTIAYILSNLLVCARRSRGHTETKSREKELPKNTPYLFLLILSALLIGYWMPDVYEWILIYAQDFLPKW